jgi:multiple sugar transport system substrate-binding protein
VKWIRRIILSLLALAALAFLARGSRRADSAPVPSDFVVIRYWEKWTGKEADQMKQIVDDFNATVGHQKKIFVQYLSMSSVDQKTLLATAAGVPPDVAGVWDNQVRQFAAMGALQCLDDMAAEHGLTRGYFKPVYYHGCCYEDRLYALPSTPGGVALHYNKRIFREKADKLRAAGLDPDRAPRTIEELDRYAAVLDTYDADGHLISAGYLPQEPGWWLTLTPYWFGGRLYDPETRRVTFTEPQVIKAFTWVQGYTKRLGAQAIQQFRSTLGRDNFDSPQSPFFTGAVAMEMEGPWKANYIAKLNPRMNNRQQLSEDQLAKLTRDQRRDNSDWAAAPLPSIDDSVGPVGYGSMDVFVIPESGKHKKEAFEFIAFVNRQDEMEKLVSLHCKTSPLAKMSGQYIANHPNPYIEVFEDLASRPNCRGLPEIAIWPEVSRELSNAIERICLDPNLSVEQALADAQVRAQAAVDRFFQRQDQRKRLESP